MADNGSGFLGASDILVNDRCAMSGTHQCDSLRTVRNCDYGRPSLAWP